MLSLSAQPSSGRHLPALNFGGQRIVPAQDAPDPCGGPALVCLRRLFETIGNTIHDGVDDLTVDRQPAIGLTTEEFGEAADRHAARQDASIEIPGRGNVSPAAQTVGNDATVHRPGRAVVVRAGAEARGTGGLRADA